MVSAVGHRAWPSWTNISAVFWNLARTCHEPGRELVAYGKNAKVWSNTVNRFGKLRGIQSIELEGVWRPLGDLLSGLGSLLEAILAVLETSLAVLEPSWKGSWAS